MPERQSGQHFLVYIAVQSIKRWSNGATAAVGAVAVGWYLFTVYQVSNRFYSLRFFENTRLDLMQAIRKQQNSQARKLAALAVSHARQLPGRDPHLGLALLDAASLAASDRRWSELDEYSGEAAAVFRFNLDRSREPTEKHWYAERLAKSLFLSAQSSMERNRRKEALETLEESALLYRRMGDRLIDPAPAQLYLQVLLTLSRSEADKGACDQVKARYASIQLCLQRAVIPQGERDAARRQMAGLLARCGLNNEAAALERAVMIEHEVHEARRLLADKRVHDAMLVFQRVLDSKVLPDEQALSVCTELAEIKRSYHVYPEANALYRKAFELADRLPALVSGRKLRLEDGYAQLLLDQRRFKEAEPLLSGLLKKKESREGRQSYSALMARIRLSRCLLRLGRAKESLLLAKEAGEGLGPEPTKINADSYSSLGRVFLSLNQPQTARELFAKALAFRREHEKPRLEGIPAAIWDLRSAMVSQGPSPETRALEAEFKERADACTRVKVPELVGRLILCAESLDDCGHHRQALETYRQAARLAALHQVHPGPPGEASHAARRFEQLACQYGSVEAQAEARTFFAKWHLAGMP